MKTLGSEVLDSGETPAPGFWSPRVGFALPVFALHCFLVFGWGLALNDSAHGYLYCRLVIPDVSDESTWHFTVAVTPSASVLRTGSFVRQTKNLARPY
jgi:hypothetical protein